MAFDPSAVVASMMSPDAIAEERDMAAADDPALEEVRASFRGALLPRGWSPLP